MKIGILGVSGYGGAELLRICLAHPAFQLVYVAGDSTAGQTLAQRFPALGGKREGALTIQRFDPARLGPIDLLFVSLPTGKSRELLAQIPAQVKLVDVGGDHRFQAGWTYGLTELPGQRAQIARTGRLANPGCYPAAALLALAPLVKEGLVESEGLVISALSGITGTGRGSTEGYGFVETNEDATAYGLASHPHVREMELALEQTGGRKATIAFTPHLAPLARGILATCYARPRQPADARALHEAARELYRDEPFVRVMPPGAGNGPHTKWAAGSNLAFLSYAVNARTGLVVAIGAIDNLGKGAAGQAVQNANLMTGQEDTAGLDRPPLWI